MTTATARRLPDGTEVTVRPMDPSDADALTRFHEALSPESQRLRFFVIHPHLTPTELQRFTTVDHDDREALVVVAGAEILGVGRYDRLDDPTVAEVAFVTRDDHQGSGIATLLFHHLATAAHAAGIKRFVAETLPENHKMLGLFTATGLVTQRKFNDGAIDVTMTLPHDPTPAPPEPALVLRPRQPVDEPAAPRPSVAQQATGVVGVPSTSRAPSGPTSV
jgi:RimJ/RimL family protein N-acetyltransferase